jgi:pimeloyl-ACP methyl ester carboxylesterase
MTEFMNRDGVALAYDSAGSGAPPIVFVHGWACDRSYFAPQFEHFAARHPVVTVDLRGHGDSDRPAVGAGVYDIAELRDDVLAVAHAAGFDRPVVIGHSLGGLVALACAGRGKSDFSTTTKVKALVIAAKARAFGQKPTPLESFFAPGR